MSADGDLLTFNTPDDWKGFGILRKYEAMQFTRKPKDKNKILGAGHRIFDMGVADAIAFRDTIAIAGGIENNYLVYSVCDKVTDGTKEKGVRTYACEISRSGSVHVLADWEFLIVLNKLKASDSECKRGWSFDDEVFNRCEQAIVDHVMADEFSPKVPVVTLSAALIQGGTC